MAKELYTIAIERSLYRKNRVKITAPLVPGFEFTSSDRNKAMLEASQRLEAFLRSIAKKGKTQPKRPWAVSVESALVLVKAPRNMKRARRS